MMHFILIRRIVLQSSKRLLLQKKVQTRLFYYYLSLFENEDCLFFSLLVTIVLISKLFINFENDETDSRAFLVTGSGAVGNQAFMIGISGLFVLMCLTFIVLFIFFNFFKVRL